MDNRADPSHVMWTHAPLAGRRAAKAFLALLLPALAIVVWYATGSVALALVAVACVALTITPAIAPTSYALSDEGIAVRHLWRTSAHPWSAFRRLAVDADLVVLSPFEKPTFRDVFRGQYLRFGRAGADVRDAAIRYALCRLPKGEEAAPAAEP